VPKLVHVRVTLIIYAVESLRFKLELKLESSIIDKTTFNKFWS